MLNKDKVPYPDEKTIQAEITQIVNKGVKPRISFFNYLMQMYRQIGCKYLFTNRLEGYLITFSVFTVLLFLLSEMAKSVRIDSDFYSILFLVSPILFTALTIYDYATKQHHETFEVEMVTKYNIYQIAAFRMFVFSIFSIFVNTVSIALLALQYEKIYFIQGILISTTSLFLFSILFLAVLMKRQSGLTTTILNLGWIVVHLLLARIFKGEYGEFLLNLPPIVYGIVISVSLVLYLHFLQKLIRRKTVEGV